METVQKEGSWLVENVCYQSLHGNAREQSNQLANEPCLGLCKKTEQNAFRDPMIHHGFGEPLTDYVYCNGRSLLRNETWGCNGTCIPYSEPCNGECLKIPRCTFLPWDYKNIDGRCIKVHDCCTNCLAGASFPIYASGTPGISTHSIQHSITKPNYSIHSNAFGENFVCPETHCSRGSKCCQLVFIPKHGRFPAICPSECWIKIFTQSFFIWTKCLKLWSLFNWV